MQMQVLVSEDEFGYIMEPYGEELLDTYWVSDEGRDRLLAAFNP